MSCMACPEDVFHWILETSEKEVSAATEGGDVSGKRTGGKKATAKREPGSNTTKAAKEEKEEEEEDAGDETDETKGAGEGGASLAKARRGKRRKI